MSDEFGDFNDDFAAYDQPGYEPVGYTPVNDTVEGLVRQLLTILDEAKPLPFSSTVRVERDDVQILLERILQLLPEEVLAARHVLKERDWILQEAERKANQVLQTASVNAARMVEKVEIVRQARMRAEQIVADAEAAARARTNEVDDHIDQYLAKVAMLADRLRQTAETGRERLRPMLQPYEVPSATPLSPEPAPVAWADQEGWSDAPPPAPAPTDAPFYDWE